MGILRCAYKLLPGDRIPALPRGHGATEAERFTSNEIMMIIDQREYRKQLSEARAHAMDNREICGLLIDTSMHISLVRVRNLARRRCGFKLSAQDVHRVANGR
jgi:hypothetical protein